jgi:hypothetical protein
VEPGRVHVIVPRAGVDKFIAWVGSVDKCVAVLDVLTQVQRMVWKYRREGVHDYPIDLGADKFKNHHHHHHIIIIIVIMTITPVIVQVQRMVWKYRREGVGDMGEIHQLISDDLGISVHRVSKVRK